MLQLSGVGKDYETAAGRLPILNDITLSLAAGDAAAITGPSGSGKSTLLYILGALERPSSGTLTLDGQDPYALGERAQAAFRTGQLVFFFKNPPLLPQCWVLETVLTPAIAPPPRDGRA